MAHTVFRSDKMHGTENAADLVNVKITEDLDNGSIVVVGAIATGEREAYTMSKPTAATALRAVALLAAPEVMYDERLKALSDFYNQSGAIVRGYRLVSGDEFSLTADGLDGTPAVGSVVELQAAYKLKVVESLTSGSTQVGTVIANEGKYWVIRAD